MIIPRAASSAAAATSAVEAVVAVEAKEEQVAAAETNGQAPAVVETTEPADGEQRRTEATNRNNTVRCIVHVDGRSSSSFVWFLFWSLLGLLAHIVLFDCHNQAVAANLDEGALRAVASHSLMQLHDVFSAMIVSAVAFIFLLGRPIDIVAALLFRCSNVNVITIGGNMSSNNSTNSSSSSFIQPQRAHVVVPASALFLSLTLIELFVSCRPVAGISIQTASRSLIRDMTWWLSGKYGPYVENMIVKKFDAFIVQMQASDVLSMDVSAAMELPAIARTLAPALLLDPMDAGMMLVLCACVRFVFGSALRSIAVPRTADEWAEYMQTSRLAICDAMMNENGDDDSDRSNDGGEAAATSSDDPYSRRHKQDEQIAHFLSGQSKWCSIRNFPQQQSLPAPVAPSSSRLLLFPHGLSAMTDFIWRNWMPAKLSNALAFQLLLDTSSLVNSSLPVPVADKEEQQQPQQPQQQQEQDAQSQSLYFVSKLFMIFRRCSMSFLRDAIYFSDELHAPAHQRQLQQVHHLPLSRACRVLREAMTNTAPFETAEGHVAPQLEEIINYLLFQKPSAEQQKQRRLNKKRFTIALHKSAASAPPVRLPDSMRLETALMILNHLTAEISLSSQHHISLSLALLQNPNFLFVVRRAVDWCKDFALTASSSSACSGNNSAAVSSSEEEQLRLVHVHEFTHNANQRRAADVDALLQVYPDAAFNSVLSFNAAEEGWDDVRSLLLFELLMVRVLTLLHAINQGLAPCFELLSCDPKLPSAPAAAAAAPNSKRQQLFSIRADMLQFLNGGFRKATGLTVLDAAHIVLASEYEGSRVPPTIVLEQRHNFRRKIASRFDGNRIFARASLAGSVPLFSVAEAEMVPVQQQMQHAEALCDVAFQLHIVLSRARRQDRILPTFNTCSHSAHAIRTVVALAKKQRCSFCSPSSSIISSPRRRQPQNNAGSGGGGAASAAARAINNSNSALYQSLMSDTTVSDLLDESFIHSDITRRILLTKFFARCAPATVPVDFSLLMLSEQEMKALQQVAAFSFPLAPPHLPREHINTSLAHVPGYMLFADEALVVLTHNIAVHSRQGAGSVDMQQLRDAAYLLAATNLVLVHTRMDMPGGHPVFSRAVPSVMVMVHQILHGNLAARSTRRGERRADFGDDMLEADDFGSIFSSARMRLEAQTCKLLAHTLCRTYNFAPNTPIGAGVVDGVAATSNATQVLASLCPGRESYALRSAILAKSVVRRGLEIVTAVSSKRRNNNSNENDHDDEDDDKDDRLCAICLSSLKQPPPEDDDDGDSDASTSRGSETMQQPQQVTAAAEHKLVKLSKCSHSFHLSCCAAFLSNLGRQEPGNVPKCPLCSVPLQT